MQAASTKECQSLSAALFFSWIVNGLYKVLTFLRLVNPAPKLSPEQPLQPPKPIPKLPPKQSLQPPKSIPKLPPKQPAKPVEVSPASPQATSQNPLQIRNPFYDSIFDEKNELRFKVISETVQKLYAILGTTPFFKWVSRRIELEGYEQEILQAHLPPYASLYFSFCDEERIKNILAFKKKACELQQYWYFKLSPRDPWKEYKEKNAAKLESDYKLLKERLPGFCQLLKIKKHIQSALKECIKTKNWDTFIDILFGTFEK